MSRPGSGYPGGQCHRVTAGLTVVMPRYHRARLILSRPGQSQPPESRAEWQAARQCAASGLSRSYDYYSE